MSEEIAQPGCNLREQYRAEFDRALLRREGSSDFWAPMGRYPLGTMPSGRRLELFPTRVDRIAFGTENGTFISNDRGLNWPDTLVVAVGSTTSDLMEENTTIEPRPGDRIAVLGPRRLGMLVIAALDAHRTRSRTQFTVTALARRQSLVDLAKTFGANDGRVVEGDGASLDDDSYDVVIDTTGSPAASASSRAGTK